MKYSDSMLDDYIDWGRWPANAKVHPTAVVAPWVSLGAGCIVHPYAIVGRVPDSSPALARQPDQSGRLEIGANTKIGCHAVVYTGSTIGSDCLIGDHALVREGCSIGDRCMIGCHVSISYECIIADDCRFQNATVFHGICGAGCFFGIGVVCSSDRRMDLRDYRHTGMTLPRFGKRVMIGTGANILAGVEIGDDALIASGALVVKDVPPGLVAIGPRAEIVEMAHSGSHAPPIIVPAG